MRRPLTASVLIFTAAASAHAQWSFSRIADSATPIPGGAGTFAGPFSAPAVSAGHVVFGGNRVNGYVTGIYTNLTGPLSRVADSTATIPGTTTHYGGFLNQVSMDGTTISFDGFGGSIGGIASSQSGSLVGIVDTSTPLPPGGSLFSTPNPSTAFYSRRGPNAAFLTGDPVHPGGPAVALYGWTSGTYHRLLDTSTPMPGGTGNFASMDFMSMGGSTVFVSTTDAVNLGGIYAVDASGGPITTIVDPNTPAPDGSGTFSIVRPVAASGNNLCFTGGTASQVGLYARVNGSLITIANRATPAPEGGFFTDFPGYFAISGQNIAFLAFSSARGLGLYSWRAGSLSRIVSVGDSLNGHQVHDILMSSEAIDGDTVAFNATLGPTPETYAVYTATIPSPAAPALFAAAALLASRRRRKC